MPWHRRILRWGQTNITEADPARYDVAWWRDYWKRTAAQGVAYYRLFSGCANLSLSRRDAAALEFEQGWSLWTQP